MSDEADTADVCAIMALLPEDVAYPCEIEITARDAQGHITHIEVTSHPPTEIDHA